MLARLLDRGQSVSQVFARRSGGGSGEGGWMAGWMAGLPDLFRWGKKALLANCEGGVGAGGWDRVPSFAGRRRERGLRRGVGCTFRALRRRGRGWRSRRGPDVGLVMAFGDLGMGAITNIPCLNGSPNFSPCTKVHIDFTSSRLAIWQHKLCNSGR